MLHLETSNKDGKYLDSPDQAQEFLESVKFRIGSKCLVNEAIGSEDRLLKPGQAVTPRFSDNHDNIVCPHCVEELCVIGTLGVGYFAGYSPAVPYLEGWWDEWCMEWFNLIKYLDVDGLAFRQGGGMNGVWNGSI
ncbi:hypothetical protein Tco_1416929 [Tanacetum coccineum]